MATKMLPALSYAEVEAQRVIAYAEMQKSSDAWNAMPKGESAMGLTSDECKTAEWHNARNTFNAKLRKLQDINKYINKYYKKERAAQINAERAAKMNPTL